MRKLGRTLTPGRAALFLLSAGIMTDQTVAADAEFVDTPGHKLLSAESINRAKPNLDITRTGDLGNTGWRYRQHNSPRNRQANVA